MNEGAKIKKQLKILTTVCTFVTLNYLLILLLTVNTTVSWVRKYLAIVTKLSENLVTHVFWKHIIGWSWFWTTKELMLLKKSKNIGPHLRLKKIQHSKLKIKKKPAQNHFNLWYIVAIKLENPIDQYYLTPY